MRASSSLAWSVAETVTPADGATRIGLNQQPFSCLKLRTMRPDAAEMHAQLEALTAGENPWVRAMPNTPCIVGEGMTVICAGGGGIPVIERGDGSLAGVEAVIDKDLASSLLARMLRADRLLLLTDVDAVYHGWGTASAQSIATAHPNALDPTTFSEGSMRPKIEAAIGFANETGKPAAIGRLEHAGAILTGAAGTTIGPSYASVSLRSALG